MADDDEGGGADGGATEEEDATVPAGLPPATAEERIAALMAELDEARDRMLRIAADCENWKKRARKEQDDAVHETRADVLRDTLEVIDGLERALGTPPSAGESDDTALRRGIELLLRSLLHKLRLRGVEPIEAAGQPFDPRIHEAISRVESAVVPAGTVAAEFERGYRFGDRLLRPARVVVSTGPAPENEATIPEHATD